MNVKHGLFAVHLKKVYVFHKSHNSLWKALGWTDKYVFYFTPRLCLRTDVKIKHLKGRKAAGKVSCHEMENDQLIEIWTFLPSREAGIREREKSAFLPRVSSGMSTVSGRIETQHQENLSLVNFGLPEAVSWDFKFDSNNLREILTWLRFLDGLIFSSSHSTFVSEYKKTQVSQTINLRTRI